MSGNNRYVSHDTTPLNNKQFLSGNPFYTIVCKKPIPFIPLWLMAKFTLHDSYELDFQLLGLVTPLRDYRICWFLNKALNIGMKRMDALEVQMNDESVWVHFTRFGCFDPLNKYYVYLLANREANYLLLPELRQADYFLMISGTTLPHTWEKVLDKTRELAQIQLVLPIDPAEIKSSQNLIFDHDIIQ